MSQFKLSKGDKAILAVLFSPVIVAGAVIVLSAHVFATVRDLLLNRS